MITSLLNTTQRVALKIEQGIVGFGIYDSKSIVGIDDVCMLGVQGTRVRYYRLHGRLTALILSGPVHNAQHFYTSLVVRRP